MIFKQSLLTGVFPLKWKKRKFLPIHKKSYKQNIENDRSVSLHPIKFLKELFLKNCLTFFLQINLSTIPVSSNCLQSPTTFSHISRLDNNLAISHLI